MPVSGIPQLAGSDIWRHPQRGMARLAGWPDPAHGTGQIDHAELFSPQIVFGHIGETAERADTARGRDAPAGFLENLAMQGGHRRLSGIDPAAGQLEFRQGVRLMRQQKVRAAQQDRVGARPALVALPRAGRFTEPSDHHVTFCTSPARSGWQPFPWCPPCPAYIHGVCQETARKETP